MSKTSSRSRRSRFGRSGRNPPTPSRAAPARDGRPSSRKPEPRRKWWNRWGATPAVALRRGAFKLVLVAVGGYLVVISIVQSLSDAVTHGIHRAGNLYSVDLRSMSDFSMDQVNGTNAEIPKPYRDLDGKHVLTVGQMWSPFGAAGQLHGFDLVYSLNNCCFRGPPLVQHFVHATVNPGADVKFFPGTVTVTGTLHVGVQKEAGSVQSIYRLDVDSVQPEF